MQGSAVEHPSTSHLQCLPVQSPRPPAPLPGLHARLSAGALTHPGSPEPSPAAPPAQCMRLSAPAVRMLLSSSGPALAGASRAGAGPAATGCSGGRMMPPQLPARPDATGCAPSRAHATQPSGSAAGRGASLRVHAAAEPAAASEAAAAPDAELRRLTRLLTPSTAPTRRLSSHEVRRAPLPASWRSLQTSPGPPAPPETPACLAPPLRPPSPPPHQPPPHHPPRPRRRWRRCTGASTRRSAPATAPSTPRSWAASSPTPRSWWSRSTTTWCTGVTRFLILRFSSEDTSTSSTSTSTGEGRAGGAGRRGGVRGEEGGRGGGEGER